MTWSFSAEMAHTTCILECTLGIKQLNTAIYQKFPKNDTPVFLKKIQEKTYKCINKGSSTFFTLIQCVHISHLLKQINDGYGNVCGKNSANEVTVYTRTRISHFTSNTFWVLCPVCPEIMGTNWWQKFFASKFHAWFPELIISKKINIAWLWIENLGNLVCKTLPVFRTFYLLHCL